MRVVAVGVVLAVITIPGVVLAQGSWWEHFEYPDGAVPPTMVSTGDPADTGAFAVLDDALSHTMPGSAHYLFPWGDAGIIELDGYALRIWGAPWDFAWRIGLDSPSAGRCLRLSHTDRYGQWAYVLSEFEWSVPECNRGGSPEWTWHRGTDLSVVLFPTDGPSDGWHEVFVWDMWARDSVRVRVDTQLIFEEQYETIGHKGYTGFGCESVGAGAPSLEYLSFWWPCPVETATWGKLKAMFR